MSIISEKIDIVLNFEELLQALAAVNDKVEATEEKADVVVERIKENNSEAFMQTLSMARAAYTLGLGMIKATGTSISYFFRSMMSAAFGAIQVLTPILTAEMLTPMGVVTGALGLAELGVAIAALVSAQAEESKIARGLRGSAMALSGVSSLLGMIPKW